MQASQALISGIMRNCRRPVFWLLLLIVSCSVAEEVQQSSSAKASAEQQAVTRQIDRSVSRIQPTPAATSLRTLAMAIPEAELLWLQGREYDPDAVMALYLPASSHARHGLVQGGMLLLHDRGQHPDWPQVIGDLRKAMPDKGWATLSLALQYPEQISMPERTMLAVTAAAFPRANATLRNMAGTQQAGSSSEEAKAIAKDPAVATPERTADAEPTVAELTSEVDIDAVKDPQAAAGGKNSDIANSGMTNTDRITLGLQQLESLGLQNRSVVAVGEGVEQLLKCLLALPQTVNKIQGMVWVNSRLDQGLMTELQNQVPDWTSIKILDVYDSTQPAFRKAADERRTFARRSPSLSYQSAPLPGLSLMPGSSSKRLLNRVWSWHKSELKSGARNN